MASKPLPADSCAEFRPLNHRVFISHQARPQNPHDTSSEPPTIILLFSWMAASPRHVSKYLHHYRTTNPTATIIHIASSATDISLAPLFPGTISKASASLTPAVDILAASPNANILLHLFSNSGLYTAHLLLIAFRARTGRPLPATALVLDSSPGRATFSGALRATRVGLKAVPVVAREIATALFALLLGVHWVVQTLGGGDTVERAREALNGAEVVSSRAVRLYLYSRADDFVPWDEVEVHVDEARAMGLQVRNIRFEESSHTAHMVMYAGEYWRAVDAVWEEGLRLKL